MDIQIMYLTAMIIWIGYLNWSQNKEIIKILKETQNDNRTNQRSR